jgi:hypothetical protein
MDDPATSPPPAAAATAPETPFTEAPALVAPRSRLERLGGPLLTAGLVGGLTIALHFRDPHAAGTWGECPWLALTGMYCPGCGGLRAVNDLTNGDIVGAASSNLIFVTMIPVLVFWWLRWTMRAWSGVEPATPTRQRSGMWIALFAAVMLVFAVLRNLPFGSWLAP